MNEGRGTSASTGIGVKGELRYHQDFAPDLVDRQIHFSSTIFENPQLRDFFGQEFGICGDV
jgi:hypothetical protein